MAKDPIVEEVRAIRAAIAAEHGNDLDAIIRALKRKQGADGRRVVNLATKRAARRQTRKAG
jgi:hypothetical protein